MNDYQPIQQSEYLQDVQYSLPADTYMHKLSAREETILAHSWNQARAGHVTPLEEAYAKWRNKFRDTHHI